MSELHTDSVRIDQKPHIIGDQALREREGDIIRVDRMPSKEHRDELLFNEEPVTIRLEPSSDRNAPKYYPVWANGKGCEILMTNQGRFATKAEDGDRWIENPWVPVGVVLTVKRKYVAIMIAAKVDTIMTDVIDRDSERPNNIVKRFTSPVSGMSIIEDRNPRGAPWMVELRRRNF